MRKSKKRRAKRILGNDRGLMFICKAIRKYWCMYGENRKGISPTCDKCKVKPRDAVDHIEPLGARPRCWKDLGDYCKRMFENKCQALCTICHKIKTDLERERRKK